MRAAIAEEQHDMELRGRDQTAMELRAEVARLRGELELADARATAVRADLLCQKQAHEVGGRHVLKLSCTFPPSIFALSLC